MRAGSLRHKIRVDQVLETCDDFGQITTGFTKLADVRAAVEPISGRERFVSEEGQEIAQTQTRFRVRYRDDLDPTMTILWRGDRYDIEAIQNIEGRDRELYLLCTTRQPERY